MRVAKQPRPLGFLGVISLASGLGVCQAQVHSEQSFLQGSPSGAGLETSIPHYQESVVKWTLLNVISTSEKTKRFLLRRSLNCITRQGVGVEGRSMELTARGEKIKELGIALQTVSGLGLLLEQKEKGGCKE